MNLKLTMTVLILFSLLGCNENQNTVIESKGINLKYRDSNNIEIPIIKSLEIDLGKNYKVQRKIKNDTTFLILDDDKKAFFGFYPWRYKTKRKPSDLKCVEKLIFETNRLSFCFCYSDALNFINELANKTDVSYFVYKKVEDSIIKLRNTKIKKLSKYDADDRLISLLLRNIDFEIKDLGNESIYEVEVGEIFSGWSEMYEHYLTNKNKDTIAAFSFTTWVN